MRPAAVIAVAALGALGAAASPSARADAGAARQALVVLLADHLVRAAPATGARWVGVVRGRRPLTRVRTVLPVLGRATLESGATLVRVALPGRPNGRTGWISTLRTLPGSTPWGITVDLGERRLTVRHEGRIVRWFRAVVGARQTPTPRGRFFVEESMSLSPAAAGAPFALATSARSDVLQEFEGGPGQIAVHGTDHLSGTPGSAASHGCIRLRTAAITWLARRIGAGVPLQITS